MAVFKNLRFWGELTDITVQGNIISHVGKTDEDGEDFGGLNIFPGLFDIHTHGCGGYDTMDEGALSELSRIEGLHGTTAFLPTTMTAPIEDVKKITNAPIPDYGRAKIMGFHLEGPYISAKYKGAQNEKFIKSPNICEFNSIQNIRMVTVAPEIGGAMEFIKNCGAAVALGHTECDYDTAIEAIENGAACLTHTFNAMPPLLHREVGPIGAAIEKNIYVQVICDGIHIHKAAVLALYKIFGRDRMILISDSMRATGLSDGKYELGGQNITVSDSVARTEDGAIAGSTSFLWDCVKRAVEFGIPTEDAVIMASKTPAALLGLPLGEIAKGRSADFVIADDDLNIKSVIINGYKII